MKQTASSAKAVPAKRRRVSALAILRRDYQLYLMMLPVVVYLFIFAYLPIYGVQIAFKDYNVALGIEGSPWVGFANFERFFRSYQFWNILKNTLILSFYSLIAGFPIPIILALMITQVQREGFKKFVQTVTYAPHFISEVVVVGMLFLVLSPSSGIVNIIMGRFGMEPINFMAESSMYKHLYVWSGVWQGAGWGSIIYIAALSSVNPELYESARMDGASKFQQILHIDLPSIMPTAIILLIMNMGSIMNQSAQKAYLMQTPLTASSQEIIATYVYKIGLIENQFSYSSAIGLFNNIINVILLVTVNTISRKVSDTSLW
ncbi:MAG: ABC transporter permease subunit [Oscillospiraceae bacterium]|nr:ABC transporter permease subunit [Oscillospiraceae bacterium]